MADGYRDPFVVLRELRALHSRELRQAYEDGLRRGRQQHADDRQTYVETPPTGPWIDRAAEIAEDLLRGPLKDVPAQQSQTGISTGVQHLAWMSMKLAAKDVGSETKTCRWLGYLQGALVTLGYSTLNAEKERNLRFSTKKE